MYAKQIISLAASMLFTLSASASVTISGTALNNATTLAAGQVGAYIVSTDGTAFSALSTLGDGLSITDSATYGGSFAFIGSNTASTVFTNTTLGSGHNFDLAGGVDAGEAFAVLVYNSSTTNTLASDTYQIWTDVSWLVPSEGGLGSFGSEFTTLTGASSFSGTVVPEPSTYAAIAGLLALGAVMIRRRR